jgi:chromate reductase
VNRPATSVLALPGSLRGASYNRRLLAAAADLAPAGTTVALFDQLSGVPLFDEDLEGAPPPAAVASLRAAVQSADGLLIATPEYNQSMPGVLKNAIDWLSRDETVLDGKPVAIIGATSGRWGTRLAQAALRQTLSATGSLVMPAPAMHVADAARLFEGAALTDGPTRQALADLLAAFACWIHRSRASR